VTTQLITIPALGMFAAAVFSSMPGVMVAAQATTIADRLISMGAALPPQPEAVATLEQLEMFRPFA
jgi:hypothetical protein